MNEPDYSKAHLDGWRTAVRDDEIAVECIVDGRIMDSWIVHRGKSTDLVERQVQIARELLLLEGICDFLNAGGDINDAENTLHFISMHDPVWRISSKLVAIEQTRETGRCYQLPDGNYLRVVDDNFSEVLDPLQFAQYLEDTADSDLDGEES